MVNVKPTPNIEFISQPYVLIQAWKKTVNYIRYHNWYADSLEIDITSTYLPSYLRKISALTENWKNDDLKIVPAPKSHPWQLKENNDWLPEFSENESETKKLKKLRPLAHVSLKDQVIATAIMLCIADRVESSQGNPLLDIKDANNRKKIISYGNRLYCTIMNDQLEHNWGSAKLYRGYFEDYQTFLKRPETVIEEAIENTHENIAVIHSDLARFYDRVSPELLQSKILELVENDADTSFINLVKKVFKWCWSTHADTSNYLNVYRKQLEFGDFDKIALPQGLVSAGFFANVVLKDFDEHLKTSINSEISQGLKVIDVCRYVDDIRIVVTFDNSLCKERIKIEAIAWLNQSLAKHASGLSVSEEKTKVLQYLEKNNPIIKQHLKMERINTKISGGFDVQGGIEILEAVQGLVRSQKMFQANEDTQKSWAFAPVPDVKDETVARFSAHRYRKTYRSLRPMLFDATNRETNEPPCDTCGRNAKQSDNESNKEFVTRADLDYEMKIFALGLIEKWMENPVNVRLLRIGLDLYPEKEVLESVLKLLGNQIKKDINSYQARVAWYILSEIFRAGATETGFVDDQDSIPHDIDLQKYRDCLKEAGLRIITQQKYDTPWYFQQQVLLFLAAFSPKALDICEVKPTSENINYLKAIGFLQDTNQFLYFVRYVILFYDIGSSGDDFVTYSILSRRSFLDEAEASELILPNLTPKRLKTISQRDPSLGCELVKNNDDTIKLTKNLELCYSGLNKSKSSSGRLSLTEAVERCSMGPNNDWRSEKTLLQFSLHFLEEFRKNPICKTIEAIPPYAVKVVIDSKSVNKVKISKDRRNHKNDLYSPPGWCDEDQRWRYHLGYLLRYILVQKYDFTRPVRKPSWKESCPIYRNAESHWYQRLHGMYSSHSAYGADWLPISDWIESFLYALLQWPGCSSNDFQNLIEEGVSSTIKAIEKRLEKIKDYFGKHSSVFFVPIKAPPVNINKEGQRPFRACIVQKVIPDKHCFPIPNDPKIDGLTQKRRLAFSDPYIRICHRNHLSTLLVAVEKMLEVRKSHKPEFNKLDLLIFPELSIHPRDVKIHLLPFVRKYKTIVIAGMNYEEVFKEQPLINSALWIIPTVSPSKGLDVIVRRQGKFNLSEREELRNEYHQHQIIQGFRPCQWIVQYEWNKSNNDKALRLTASICYDATDLQLAGDLRDRSDVYIIPSFNQDVKTFDQMSLALHYHMYQMVIVANNGMYGGSSAFIPYAEDYKRQVLHLHGQPQATAAFFEIDDIDDYLERHHNSSDHKEVNYNVNKRTKSFKYPPAGLNRSDD